MQKFVIALMAAMLLAGLAVADKPVPEKPIQPYMSNSRAAEAEPNDDYTTANPLVVGDDMNAAIDIADDMDFFAFEATAGATVTFETMPGDIGDTKMYLFDTDGITELAYNDDIGYPNYYSQIEYTFAADGIYFIEVIGYSSSYTGTYILTAGEADPPCPAPENNTCEGAIELPFGSTVNFNNCGATNDYTTSSGGCTGYSANGIDVVYYVDLVEDQQLTVTATTSYDNAIYLVTDCADIDNTCVAGADATTNGVETLVFDAADAPGRYFLILDGYSSTSEGDWEVVIDGVVATQQTTFDSLKSLYR